MSVNNKDSAWIPPVFPEQGSIHKSTEQWIGAVCLVVFLLLLQGCNKEPEEEWIGAAYSIGVNHTKNSIIRFELSTGAGGRVPPYGESGVMMGGGSYPKIWRPDFEVEVNWAVDTDPFAYGRWRKEGKNLAEMKHTKIFHQHNTTVVPEYYGEDTCGVEIHFFPCNEVKIQLACYDANHPDKTLPQSPQQLEEPEVCP